MANRGFESRCGIGLLSYLRPKRHSVAMLPISFTTGFGFYSPLCNHTGRRILQSSQYQLFILSIVPNRQKACKVLARCHKLISLPPTVKMVQRRMTYERKVSPDLDLNLIFQVHSTGFYGIFTKPKMQENPWEFLNLLDRCCGGYLPRCVKILVTKMHLLACHRAQELVEKLEHILSEGLSWC